MKSRILGTPFTQDHTWWKTACAVALLCAMTAIASPAQTFTTLVNFDGTDGENPFYTSLVRGTDGNLYGTTPYGGANRAGTVFKMTPSGTLTMLYSFCAQSDCTDGETPQTGLVLGTDGNFYGTTYAGGSGTACTGGCGTVFKITSGGTLTTLHSFDSTDGAFPFGGALIQATNGSFYGTTSSGGVVGGTLFKITSGGTFTLLHSFEGPDGSEPVGGLIQATDGNLYGTTFRGGANGVGTVFKVTLAGTLTTLYSFCTQSGCTDGENPLGGLVQASNGIFYGTTYDGGANNGGTVFNVTSGGTLTTLYNFGSLDGFNPEAALIQATDGNFYGTTYLGGANDEGTVFKITSVGTLTTLDSFCSESGCADGETPAGALVQATNGTFYGATPGGGTNGDGTVFSLAVGLGSFVETLPTSGKVAATVKILGTNLAGATAVSFNGTAATFKVVSSSEITTTVPTGATTGKVKVVTPSRTLKSNVSFRVP